MVLGFRNLLKTRMLLKHMIQLNKFTTKSMFLYLMGMLLVVSSCDKTPSNTPTTALPNDSLAHGIFICNEGNFQWGNASLSFYNTSTGTIQEDVFKSVNKRGVGDVLQSICIVDDKAFLVVNNSQKIEIIDSKTIESKGVITGFNSPRYFLSLGSNKAYVSDLYEKAVWIVNPAAQSITGKIAINSWTEEMINYGTKVFVCGRTSGFVYVINTSTNLLEDSIAIGYGAQNIVLDAENKIWVLTVGKDALAAQLHKINPNTNALEKSWSLPDGALPNKLICNSTKSKLYFINKDVFELEIHSTSLPTTALVQANGRTFYGLGFNPWQNEILISDAKDYIQKSEVYRYDTLGQLKGSFKTGMNTTYFNWK
ncbi:MAG: hypothetical protein CFE21_02890 [Bacteroidetes bacterium B1(2017)]|nr:MAG: hypothetical protein CFE21_02890 [Bacteroidetes bacterium B1(2017)]